MQPSCSTPPRRRLLPFLALLAFAAALAAGCAQQRFAQLFDESFARKTLSCLHPHGEFASAGEVKAESGDAFTGTIFWKGGTSQNNYYTKVRVTIDGKTARIAVLEDTSILPALNDDCRVDLGGN